MTEIISRSRFMNVKQVAAYLHLNEKKIYLLASEGRIPGTKITGKWLFPRELIDQWVLNSSHNGLMADRLIVSGSDDALLPRVIAKLSRKLGANALINYSSTSVDLGLQLLQRNRTDIGCIRWGPAKESDIRHPAFLQRYEQHRDWILVRAFSRQQGVIIAPKIASSAHDLDALLSNNYRWAKYEEGTAAQRIFSESLNNVCADTAHINYTATARSEREAASMIAMNIVDSAPGAKSSATEFGLNFIPLCWENIDFVMRRKTYFRTLFQKLLEDLQSYAESLQAGSLGGYDLADCGKIIWCYDEY